MATPEYLRQHYGVVPPTAEIPRISTPENLAKRTGLSFGSLTMMETYFCSDPQVTIQLPSFFQSEGMRPVINVEAGKTYLFHIAVNSASPLSAGEQLKFPFTVNMKSSHVAGTITGAYYPEQRYVGGIPIISTGYVKEAVAPGVGGGTAAMFYQTDPLGSLQSTPGTWYCTLFEIVFTVTPDATEGEEIPEYDVGGELLTDPVVLCITPQSFYVVPA